MVGVCGDQDMRQQARAETVTLDWRDGKGACVQDLAAGTGKARPHDPVHDEPSRNIFQLFSHILAEAAQRPAAMATVVVTGGQFDLLARNVAGDKTALRLVLLPFIRKAQLRGHFGDGDLTGLQSQLKLLDRLRRRVKPVPAVTGELVARLLDQRRLRLYLSQQKRREPLQFLGMFRS